MVVLDAGVEPFTANANFVGFKLPSIVGVPMVVILLSISVIVSEVLTGLLLTQGEGVSISFADGSSKVDPSKLLTPSVPWVASFVTLLESFFVNAISSSIVELPFIFVVVVSKILSLGTGESLIEVLTNLVS